jgi:LemA protein
MWIVIILFVLILFVIVVYNKLTSLKKTVEQSHSGIDVFLEQRFDLIPNLVETVKGYTKYEQETLENIIKLRNEYTEKKDFNLNNDLSKEFSKLFAVAENYPDLKASEQFLQLQKSLIKIESQLQAARRIYNNDVTRYNTKIHTFPNNIIASIFSFTDFDLFSSDDTSEMKINI